MPTAESKKRSRSPSGEQREAAPADKPPKRQNVGSDDERISSPASLPMKPSVSLSALSSASSIDSRSSTSTAVNATVPPSPSTASTSTSPVIHLRALIVTQDASVIIGKGGSHVSEIRELSGAKVAVSEPVVGNPERVLTVSGPLDAVAKAFGLIVRRINDEPFDAPSVPGSRAVTVKFLIPNLLMGSVIGRAGVKVKEIQEASGARLNASEATLPGSGDRVLAVAGVADAVHIAAFHVGQILLEMEAKQRDESNGQGRRGGGYRPAPQSLHTQLDPQPQLPPPSTQPQSLPPHTPQQYSTQLHMAQPQQHNVQHQPLQHVQPPRPEYYAQGPAFTHPPHNQPIPHPQAHPYSHPHTHPQQHSPPPMQQHFQPQYHLPHPGHQPQYMQPPPPPPQHQPYQQHPYPPQPHAHPPPSPYHQHPHLPPHPHANAHSGQQPFFPPPTPPAQPHLQPHPHPHPHAYPQQTPPQQLSTVPHSLQQEIFIPNDLVGCIIGKGGSKINEIRQSSGTTIRIMDPAGGGANAGAAGQRMITVYGPTANVQLAVSMLVQRVEQEKRRLASGGVAQA